MANENLTELRALRAQEKATKARIIIVKPLAIEEAKILKPDGGKFTVNGVGDFVLDKDPILDIETSHAKEAVEYRRLGREQQKLKAQSAQLTKQMKGFYDAFKEKNAAKAKDFNWNLKCQGIDA